MASANPRQHQPPDSDTSHPVLEQEVQHAKEAITACQRRIDIVKQDIDIVRIQGNVRFVSHGESEALVQLEKLENTRRRQQLDDARQRAFRSVRAESEAPIQLRQVSEARVEHTTSECLREMYFTSPRLQALLQRTRDYGIVDHFGRRHPGDASTMECLLSPQSPSHDSELEIEEIVNKLLVDTALKKFIAIGICNLEPETRYYNNVSHTGPKGVVVTYDGKERMPTLTYPTADVRFQAACGLIWNSGSQVPVLRNEQQRVVERMILSDPTKYSTWFNGNVPFSIAQVITLTNVEGRHVIFDLAQSSAPRSIILRVLGDSSVCKIIADHDDINASLPTALLTPRDCFYGQTILPLDTFYNRLTVPGIDTSSTYLQLVRRLRQLPATNPGSTLSRAADTYFHTSGFQDINGRSILRHHSYYGVPNEQDFDVLEEGGSGYDISKTRAIMAMDVILATMSSDARTLSEHVISGAARAVREVSSKLLVPTTIIPFAQNDYPVPPPNWLCRFSQPCIDPFLEQFNQEGKYRTRMDELHNDKARLEKHLSELKNTLRRASDRLTEWQTTARRRKSLVLNDDEEMQSASPVSRSRTESTSTSSRTVPRSRSKSRSSRHYDSPRANEPPPRDPNRYRRIHADLPTLTPQTRIVPLQQQAPIIPVASAEPTFPPVTRSTSASVLSFPKVDREAAAKLEMQRKLAPTSEDDGSSRQTRQPPPASSIPPTASSGTPANVSTAPTPSSLLKQRPDYKPKPADPPPTDPEQFQQWVMVCRSTWPEEFQQHGQLNTSELTALLGIDWSQFPGLRDMLLPFTRTSRNRPRAPCPQVEITPAQYTDYLPLNSPEAICLKNWKITFRNAYKSLCKMRPFACAPILYSALASEAILFAEYACNQWLLAYPEKRYVTASLLLEFYLFVVRSCVVPTLFEHCSLRGETETGQTPHPDQVLADVIFSANTSQLYIVTNPTWRPALAYVPHPVCEIDVRLQRMATLQAAIPTEPVTVFADRLTIPYLLGRIISEVYTKPPFSGSCASQPLIGSSYTPPTFVRNTFSTSRTMHRLMSSLPEETSLATTGFLPVQSVPETSLPVTMTTATTTSIVTDDANRLSASGTTETTTPTSVTASASLNAQDIPRTSVVEHFEETIDSVVRQLRTGQLAVQPMEIENSQASTALTQHLHDAMMLYEQTPPMVTCNVNIGDTISSITRINDATGEVLYSNVQPVPPAGPPQNQLKEGEGIDIIMVPVDDEPDFKNVTRISDNNDDDNNNTEVPRDHSPTSSSEHSNPSPARYKARQTRSSSGHQQELVSTEEREQQPQQQQHQRASSSSNQKKKPPGSGKKRRSRR